MAYVVEPMDSPLPSAHSKTQSQLTPDLPSKSFTGYDTAAEAARIKDKALEGKPEAQQKQVETTEEPQSPANPSESVTLSPKISALARKEQATRQREQALVQ